MSDSFILPTKKLPKLTQDPKNLIIYGVPKIEFSR